MTTRGSGTLCPAGRPSIGSPGNTGDGLRMAEKVGASMWHMTGQTVVVGYKAEGYDAAFFVIFLNPGFIYVDKYGKRFLVVDDERNVVFLTDLDDHEPEQTATYAAMQLGGWLKGAVKTLSINPQ